MKYSLLRSKFLHWTTVHYVHNTYVWRVKLKIYVCTVHVPTEVLWSVERVNIKCILMQVCIILSEKQFYTNDLFLEVLFNESGVQIRNGKCNAVNDSQ